MVKRLPLLILLGLAVLTAGRSRIWASPIGLWADAAGKSPGNPRPLVNLGFLYQHEGRLAEAGCWYRAALRRNPRPYFEAKDWALIRNDLAATEIDSGDYLAAERELAAIDLKTAPVYLNAGLLELRERKPLEALTLFNRAVDTSHSALAFFDRGEAFRALRDPIAAQADYRAALEIEPRFTPALERLEALR